MEIGTGASRAKIVERMRLIVVSRSSTASCTRSATCRIVEQSQRGLERQPDGEQLLDDRVVEVHGDALAILEQGEVPHAGVQPGVLDGDAGGRGQRDDELLVDVGEHVPRPLVGQVEVAEHLARAP